MRSIQKMMRRWIAWLLCLAVTLGCFSGPGQTALAVEEETAYEAIKIWTFESDIEGWQFNSGWSSDYKGGDPDVALENGQLKLNMDYSEHGKDGWMQAAISCGQDQMPDLSGAVRITMDVSYEPSKLTDGALTIKVSLGEGDGSISVADSQSSDLAESDLVKKTITIELSKEATKADFVLCIVGQNTTYHGSIWLDNIKVEKAAETGSGDTGLMPPETELRGLEEEAKWLYLADWGWQYSGASNSSAASENGMLRITADYSGDAGKDYSKMVVGYQNGEVSFENATKVTFDFYYDTAKMTQGGFKIGFGSSNDVLKISETDLDLSKAETVTGTLKRLPVTLICTSIATGTVQEVTISLIGVNTDYKGNIWLDDIQFATGGADGAPPVTSLSGLEETGSWYYGNGWENNYHGATNSGVSQETGMVKATVDYSADADQSYSKLAISYWNNDGVSFENITKVTFDLYYDTAKMTQGSFKIGVTSDALAVDDTAIDLAAAETVSGTLKKLPVILTCENAFGTVQGISFLLIGVNTDYRGNIWLDNIQFVPATAGEDVYVDAAVTANTATSVSGSSSALTVNGANHTYAAEIQLADPDANADTVALYQYLKAVGESDGALFGHMEDTVLKAGSKNLSESDTKDLTGSLAAINGLDCGGLFSGFAGKYNARHSGEQIADTTEGNIRAAALLSNEAIAEGAIITLSMHMPNFAYATVKDASAAKSYDRYDYTKADSYNLTGDCMNQILPGGAFNPQFTAYLDLVAEYAQQVNGPILFRPFHENTGSWFWWGKAFCDAETYKSVFRYTVEYLRDTKEVHNLLYVYGPGSEAATIAEYDERYPGDAYVDMVGFDTYDEQASNDANYRFMQSFEATVKLTDQFAKEHNKLFAVTETGITNSAMKKQGNERPQWFTEILDIITKSDYDCVYYMVWSNYDSNSNYYMPFAVNQTADGKLHGHELMDPFICFYNDQRSIFASDQKAVIYGGTKPAAPNVTAGEMSGYFVTPIAGSRILTETVIRASASVEITDATISVSNGAAEFSLDTAADGKTVSAVLTSDILAQLGEAANGKILLRCGNKTLAEITAIFNIPEEERDPYLVDDFESYYGTDSMLTAAWATNKATGSIITLTLDNANTQDGYAMKFAYTEQSGGWAGATITKGVDWTNCNALQFWTIPDGKQQKTVIQIEANTCYEFYLNEYDEYNARAGQPTLVTIPFSEFCQRDTVGNPKGGLLQDRGSVSSFGLWVNAIDNDFFEDDTVSGTIWYDNITAVTTDKTRPAFEALSSQPPVAQSFTITASAGIGGTITPSGSVAVSKGGSQRFIFTPDSGYIISDVRVDGISVGTVNSYTFENVAADHIIDVVFAKSGSSSDPTGPSLPAIPVWPTTPSGGAATDNGSSEGTPSSPKTVTVTDPVTGTVTETTEYADGSQIVVVTKTDGTITTVKTDGAGNSTTIVKHPDGAVDTVIQKTDGSASSTTAAVGGKVETEVSLPNEIVIAAQNTVAVIPLPMPVVTVAADLANAPTITLDTGNITGPVKVEIPVANVAAGTVAVRVRSDGTEEVVKKSVPSVDGLILSMEEGVTIKVIDRSKYFSDAENHWSADAIAFVSARDIFLGTAENVFSPDAPMTRAMLVTVLARLDGVDTTGGATWYEKGVEWAMENNVSDGSNPEHEITREQLAVMLYRYIGSPAISGSLDGFVDADETSGYALDAMQWAVEQGILTGKPGGVLDPQAFATRTEVAAMLMRFIRVAVEPSAM